MQETEKEEVLYNEAQRISELQRYRILDTPPEAVYDDIIKLASEICQTPIAMMTLIDTDRQFIKSQIGADVGEVPRDETFCTHTIQRPQNLLIVGDATTDVRFSRNQYVTGEPHIRFYAGAPLVTDSGEALGSLCVYDDKPRQLTTEQSFALKVLARQIVAQLELRRIFLEMRESQTRQKVVEQDLRDSEELFKAFMNNSPTVAYMKDEAGRFVYVNQMLEKLFDVKKAGLLGKTDFDVLPESEAQIVQQNDRRVIAEGKPLQLLENVHKPDGTASHWLSLKFPFANAHGDKFLGGVSIDITARVVAEKNMNDSERRYRHLFELSPGFINIHRLDGVIIEVNEAAAKTLGYQPDQIIGNNLADFVIPKLRPLIPEYLERVSRTSFDEGIFYVQTKSGEERAWQYRNRLHEEADGSAYIIGYAQDVTQLKETEEHLQNLSLTDEMTKLYNRRGFFTLAEQAVRYARRNSKSGLVIYADLDNLKEVNDRFGHETGSQMIVDTSNIFKSSIRDSDIVGRIGGDEFVALIQDVSEAGLKVIENRLHEEIRSFNAKNSRPFKLSISFGIVRFDPLSDTTIEKLVSQADRLMYAQKTAKKMVTENRL